MGEHDREEASLTCHEAVHMEKGHDHKGLVFWGQLIGGNDVGQAGGQVALIQWHTLQAIVSQGGRGNECGCRSAFTAGVTTRGA